MTNFWEKVNKKRREIWIQVLVIWLLLYLSFCYIFNILVWKAKCSSMFDPVFLTILHVLEFTFTVKNIKSCILHPLQNPVYNILYKVSIFCNMILNALNLLINQSNDFVVCFNFWHIAMNYDTLLNNWNITVFNAQFCPTFCNPSIFNKVCSTFFLQSLYFKICAVILS